MPRIYEEIQSSKGLLAFARGLCRCWFDIDRLWSLSRFGLDAWDCANPGVMEDSATLFPECQKGSLYLMTLEAHRKLFGSWKYSKPLAALSSVFFLASDWNSLTSGEWTYPLGQQFRHQRGNESFTTMTATISKRGARTDNLPNTVLKRRRR